jgi:hypothetical protein
VQKAFKRFLKNFKKRSKSGQKRPRLFESWQEETHMDTLETHWAWAAWVS